MEASSQLITAGPTAPDQADGFHHFCHAMAEAAALHQLVVDTAGQAVDYRILDVNPAYTRLFDRPRASLVGQFGTDVFGAPVPFLDYFHAVADSERATSFETRENLTGQVLSVSVFSPAPNHFVTLITDITAAKAREADLCAQLAQFRLVERGTAVLIYKISSADGIFQYASPKAAALFGCVPGDFYQQPELLDMLIHPDARSTFAEEWRKLRRGEPSACLEYRIMRRDGTVRWIGQQNQCLHDQAESVLTIIATVEDITERKQGEQLDALRHRLADRIHGGHQREILQDALEAAEQWTQSTIGFFHFVENDQETIALQTWSRRTLREMCVMDAEGLHYPISKAGVWVDCIRQGKAVVHNDYAALDHRKGLPEGHVALVRELVVPVFREGHIVAVMGVGNKSSLYNEQDKVFVSAVADMACEIVERQRADQQIRFMAYHDVLTGLPNRELFADRLKQATALALRENAMFAICYLDLDGFKPVNDNYGHQAGDRLLIQLAKRLQQVLRDGDTVARLGGDEFVLLLTGLDNIYQGEAIVERTLETVAQPYEFTGKRLHLSASIGVTFFPDDHADADTLLRHADQAMYQAKAMGKNTYRLHDPVQDRKVQAHRRALTEIERAIREDRLVLYYQPRLQLQTGDIAGAEALVRWPRPDQGPRMPVDFLPSIENTPQEIALDEWVMRKALEQHLHWREQGLLLPVSVNISPRQLQRRDFPEFLGRLLAPYPADVASYLELEMLETSVQGDIAGVVRVMETCREQGVRFALDDFGTGCSSLTCLQHLPIDLLKIDQRCVRDMLRDPRARERVEGVLRLAAALKRPVVAEGVESLEVGLVLTQLGCPFVQGNGVARPMPAEAIPAWWRDWQENPVWRQWPQEIGTLDAHPELNVWIFMVQRWLASVFDFIKGQPGAARPDCAGEESPFACWYKGVGKVRYGSHPAYSFILPKHNTFLEMACALLLATERSESAQVVDQYTNLDTRGHELIDMIRRLAGGDSA